MNVKNLGVYDYVGCNHNGYASVKKGSLFGLLDMSNGELVLPCDNKHGSFVVLDDGVTRVIDNDGKYGLFDTNTKIFLTRGYYDGLARFDDYYLARLNNKLAILDLELNIIIPFQKCYYIWKNDFGYYEINFDAVYGKHQIVSSDNKVILTAYGKNMSMLSENRFAVNQKNGTLLLNRKGNIISAHDFDAICVINTRTSKYFQARIKERWGIINKDGKEITAFIYDSTISMLNENIFMVEENQKKHILKFHK